MSGYTRDFDAKYDPTSKGFQQDRVERAIPRFWTDEVYNKRTKELDLVEMVEIVVPGETKNIWAGKVTDAHKKRFPAAYQAFKNNEEAPANGTPLTKLPGMHHQLLGTLKFLGFTSIEDLARATDQAIGEFQGGLTWRKKAQNFVDEQRQFHQKTDEKDRVIAEQGALLKTLQEQMAALSAQMAASQSGAEPVKKKPGRKPKAETEQVAA